MTDQRWLQRLYALGVSAGVYREQIPRIPDIAEYMRDNGRRREPKWPVIHALSFVALFEVIKFVSHVTKFTFEFLPRQGQPIRSFCSVVSSEQTMMMCGPL